MTVYSVTTNLETGFDVFPDLLISISEVGNEKKKTDKRDILMYLCIHNF